MELTPHTKLSVATPVALKERKKKKSCQKPFISEQSRSFRVLITEENCSSSMCKRGQQVGRVPEKIPVHQANY